MENIPANILFLSPLERTFPLWLKRKSTVTLLLPSRTLNLMNYHLTWK